MADSHAAKLGRYVPCDSAKVPLDTHLGVAAGGGPAPEPIGEGDGPDVWSPAPSGTRGSRPYRKLSTLPAHIGGVVTMAVVADADRVLALCGTGTGEIKLWGPSLAPLGRGFFSSLFQTAAARRAPALLPSSTSAAELKYGKGFAASKPSRAPSPFDCL